MALMAVGLGSIEDMLAGTSTIKHPEDAYDVAVDGQVLQCRRRRGGGETGSTADQRSVFSDKPEVHIRTV